ncbi:methylmalonic aciduria and homocystinuria type D protein [Pleurocapsa sp. PCC 7319]|uniref:methylmalonic aciduria and homocystinuria type D protein n=1 Tax=Pleurocapsa sp. PCC 7319 TaxID=118161 RepID=UPI000349200D|nr:methylmalonic aciduria and homocystinuria type D protein [Pleurocapsa sp. PCC 7319]
MRSPFYLKIFQTPTGREVQVCIAPPHQFVFNHQQQLLPDWNQSVAHLIVVLQQSSISLKESNFEVAQEKDNLRAEFIRFGCTVIFGLRAQGYKSDLFDPRTGQALLAPQGKLTLNDNAVVQALLDYPVVSYQNCSLLTHPLWGNKVYPSTMATVADQKRTQFCLEQVAASQKWITKSRDY